MLKAVLYDWGGLNVWLFHLVNQWHAPFWDAPMRLGTTLGNHGNFPVYMALAVEPGCRGGVADAAAARDANLVASRIRPWLA